MKNKILILSAGLLAYAAWRYSQNDQTDTSEGEGFTLFEGDGLNVTADDVLTVTPTETVEEEGGFIATTFGNAMNELRNLIGGNDIAAIVEAGPGFLVVRRPDGSVQKLTGARNWRNNNPGNIEYGDYSRSMGAIGTDGRFAVFPTYAMGKRAKEKLIFEGSKYQGLSLTDAISRYAPPSENNTAWYQRIVLAAVGGVNKLMNQYTASERSSILAAMEKVEGFKVGKVQDVPMA